MKRPWLFLVAFAMSSLSSFLCVEASDTPENAGLLYSAAENGERVIVPLKSTLLVVDIGPGIVETTVVQEFSNETDAALECSYLYPLPTNATISNMEIRYEDRVVSSVVKEKAEAKAVYEEAKASGKKAALASS